MNRTVTMQQPKRAATLNIRTITMTALLSAIAYVLAFVEFPVPLSPSFAKMDLSDFPALIGAFAFGPISGLLIELVKNALQLLTTSTGGIGEIANFLMGAAYEDLLNLVRDKDYFVITTNVDHCFQKAGFDKKRLFYTQGDYGLFQCSEPCCQETLENETVIREMVEQQEDMKIPTELLPVCPHCGKPLTMNLRSDDKFVEDEGWHRAAERYENFLRTHAGQKILFLELGVGYNTPVIIKYPFWQMTAKNPNATYVCINQGQAVCPREIQQQSICINADIGSTLQGLSQM